MVTLATWHERMSEDLRLRDMRPRTQQGYLAATRQFMQWVHKEPQSLEVSDVRRYILYLREEKELSPSSVNVAIYALRFFFMHTMQREWKVFELLRSHKPRKLPVVLSPREVRLVLGAVEQPVRRMALSTIYALGLRLGEGLRLQTGHVDAERLVVWVRNGKGARDRAAALPRPVLYQLRRYWKEVRPASDSSYFFIRPGADAPLHPTTLQKTFKAACRDSGMSKDATIHSLRHSYATHLLEQGITLRTIQHLLGHRSMRTTEVYMHVTKPATETLQRTLDELMRNL